MRDARRPWILLAALSGVLGLVVLDETVVGAALPTMAHDLGLRTVPSHWVVNAYLLTFTIFVALGGRLGDIVGRGRLFLAGLAFFALGSLGAGLAPHAAVLIGARAVQGVGAALVFPATFAIMTHIFPPERRGLAFGLQTTVAGLFMASGPLIGGAFSELLSWRYIFLLNLPLIAAIAAIVLAAWMPALSERHRAEGGARFDAAGLLTLIVGVSAFTIALMQGVDWGWLTAPTLSLLAVGLAGLAAFAIVETRRTAPLIDLALLRIGPFTAGVLVFAAFQWDKIVVFVFVPLFLQSAGFSPIEAGLPIVIAVLPATLTSALTGTIADRFGTRRVILAGVALNGAMVLLFALAALLKAMPLLYGALFVWGAGLPFISVVPRRALMSAVPVAQQGEASGVNLTIQMMGGTLGLAVASALLAATGSYAAVFLATGLVVLVMVLVVAALVRPPAASG